MTDDIKVRVGLDSRDYVRGVAEMKRANMDFQQNLGRTMADGARLATQAANALARIEIAQISLGDAHERVARAQRDYNQAVEEHGRASQQAIQASQDLDRAQTALEKTQLRSRVAFGLAAVEIAKIGSKAPVVVAGLTGTATAAFSAARGLSAMQLAGSAAVGTLGAIGVLLAGLSAWDAYATNVKKGATATEELRMAQEALDEAYKQQRADPTSSGILKPFNELVGKLKFVQTATEAVEAAEKRLESAKLAVAAEENASALAKQAQAARDAADAQAKLEAAQREFAQSQNRLVSEVSSAWSGVGISMSQFSADFQKQMLASVGVTEEFIAALQPAVKVEQLLAQATGPTRKALIDQMDIQMQKGESAEELTARLQAMGMTEEEVASVVERVTAALDGQTGAMNRNAAGVGGRGGGDAQALATLLDANKESLIKAALGKNYTYERYQDRLKNFNPADIIKMLSDPNSGFSKGKYGQGLMEAIKNLILGKTHTSSWDSLLAALGIQGLAHGGTGLVTRPSLLRVGEHGPEHIAVNPVSRGGLVGGGGGGGDIHVHIGAIHASDRAGGHAAGEACSEAIARRLKRLGVWG